MLVLLLELLLVGPCSVLYFFFFFFNHSLFLSLFKLEQEVPPFVQVIHEVIIGIHLYLLTHFEIVINYQVKLAFKLFLVHLGFLSHEGLVADVGHIVNFRKILVFLELFHHLVLDLFEIFFPERFFSQPMLQPLIVNELEFIDLVKCPSLSFIIYSIHNVEIPLTLGPSSNPVLEIIIIFTIALALDSSNDIERATIISVTTAVSVVL